MSSKSNIEVKVHIYSITSYGFYQPILTNIALICGILKQRYC